MSNLVNDFEVRKETLRALGGNPDGLANIYEVDLEILKLTGGSGSGAASHESVDGVNYLTFVAIEDSTIKIIKHFNGSYGTYTFEYSTDNAATWNSYTLDTEISLKAGENVKFRGNNPNGLAEWGDFWLDLGPNGYHKFVMTGKIAAYGSIMSLLSTTLNITKTPYSAFCYLFNNCTSLIKAPELPATETNDFCYCGLFNGCTNLAIAPELPSTSLYHRCYMSMFSGCTSLVESPVLPATKLGYECYRGLFGDCINLRKITCYAPDSHECFSWHPRYFGTGFSKEGTFIKAKGSKWGIDSDMTGDDIPYGWTVVEVDVYIEAPMDGKQYARQKGNWTPVESVEPGIPDAPSDGKTYGRNNGNWTVVESGGSVIPEGKYMTITVLDGEAGTTIAPTVTGTLSPLPNLQYRVNNGSWNDFIVGTTADIHAVAGDVVQFKGLNPSRLSTSGNDYLNFAISGNPVHLSGNVMSLIDGVGDALVIPNNFCFCKMFSKSKVKTVSSDFLPATELTSRCYSDLFSECSLLENSPELPALTMKYFCYGGMFYGCQNLTQAPALPSLNLEERCYSSMFYGCEKLTQAPALPAEISAPYCYSSMFLGCQKLTQAPILPAKVLLEGCYEYMFMSCDSLNYVKCSATEGNVPSALDNWLSIVSSTGTFVKPAGVSYETGGNGIPSGWTVKEFDEYIEAPKDGNQYARQNAAWVEVSKVKTTNNTTLQFWNGTQQEYDAIATKDANTLYIIS